MEKRISNFFRDWTQIYVIYGVADWQTPLFLLVNAVGFAALSVVFLLYFEPICLLLQQQQHFLQGPAAASFTVGFTGSVTALSTVCLLFAASNFFYSAVALHWEMSQRIVSSVPDWSSIKYALDVGS